MKTKDDIVKHLRGSGVSGVLAERIGKLMNQFATADGFFSASKGDIMKAYKKVAPFTKHGLGKAFWEVFDKANAFMKGKIAEGGEKPKKEDKMPEVNPNVLRMMSLEELKTVVAFMELCDVEAVNIVEISGFLKSVRMRQSKAAGAVQATDGHDGR